MTPSQTIKTFMHFVINFNKRSNLRFNAPNILIYSGKRLDRKSILIYEESLIISVFLSLNFNLEIDLISIELSNYFIP